MALEFKVYESSTEQLVSIGTPAKLAGKGGKVLPVSLKNWNSKKLVTMKILRKNGTSCLVPCSEQVSTDLRNKDLTLPELVRLPIFECEVKKRDKAGDVMYDEDGEVLMETANFISYQGSGAGNSAPGVDIKDSHLVGEAKVKVQDWEGLIAFS